MLASVAGSHRLPPPTQLQSRIAEGPGADAGLVGLHRYDLPLGVDMLYRTRNKYPWLEMQSIYPFSEEGIGRAVADAVAMKTVKSPLCRGRNWRASAGPHRP
jgi:hypothetical protein